jgi:hypothetical protein
MIYVFFDVFLLTVHQKTQLLFISNKYMNTKTILNTILNLSSVGLVDYLL